MFYKRFVKVITALSCLFIFSACGTSTSDNPQNNVSTATPYPQRQTRGEMSSEQTGDESYLITMKDSAHDIEVVKFNFKPNEDLELVYDVEGSSFSTAYGNVFEKTTEDYENLLNSVVSLYEGHKGYTGKGTVTLHFPEGEQQILFISNDGVSGTIDAHKIEVTEPDSEMPESVKETLKNAGLEVPETKNTETPETISE